MTVPTRMIILWMSGLTWDMVNQMPTVGDLRMQGATVTRLEPLPITGSQSQAWQMLSGQSSGYTGYFDSWVPLQYTAQPASEPTIYGLREVIAEAGHKVNQVKLAPAELPDYLQLAATDVDCLLIQSYAAAPVTAIEQAVKAARTWAGHNGCCLLLSDQHAAPVQSYVNLNDGLRKLGVLETSEEDTIHWEETLAYHIGHGQLWINLEGREAAGIVAPGKEYEQVCQALITSLTDKLLDPQTGKPVIEQVYHRDQLYHGDYLFRAPDLVVVLRPGYAPSPNSTTGGFDGVAVYPAPANIQSIAGLHPTTVSGLLIATGAPFSQGQMLAQASLMAVAPSILHTLGLPIPVNMDTGVITDVFASTYMQQHPIQRAEQGADLSTEDEEEIMARLKSLGYVG